MNLSKNVFAISIFLGILVAPISLISPVKAAADVVILSHTGYLNPIAHYHVVGEVQNVGKQALSFVKIIATFYDSSDVVVATDFTYTDLDVLLVGRKSPFDLVLFDETQSLKVNHYSLSVTSRTTSPLPIGLKILSNSSYTNLIGSMHIVGEIKNIGDARATYVKAIATYYDETGTVVATDFSYSNPYDIEPGQKAPFDIVLSSASERVPYVDRYALTAESSQYAIKLPEDTIPPVASAGSDQTVDEDTVVTFDGSASSDNVGIIGYTWTFTDGILQKLTGVSPTYTFDTPGRCVVTLKVTDAAGNYDADTVTITVMDVTDPIADAGSDRTVNIEQELTFGGGDSSDNVGIVSYEWDFGDGQSGTGVTVTHTYSNPETYTVILTVRDAAGNSDTDSIIVTVTTFTDGESFSLWILGAVVGIALIGIALIGIVLGTFFLARRRSVKG